MKMIVEVHSPVTQPAQAVVEMLKSIGRKFDPLPDAVHLPGMALVLSSKRDCYYATLPSTCSCPARTYHPEKPCKHMKQFFSEAQIPKKTLLEAMAEEGYEMSFEPDPKYDPRAKIEAAKAKIEVVKQQARAYQAKQRELRNLAKLGCAQPDGEEILVSGKFKPVLE